jgi:hypothetical protein
LLPESRAVVKINRTEQKETLLCEALKAQNQTYDAQFVEPEFQAAWKGTDANLQLDDLI